MGGPENNLQLALRGERQEKVSQKKTVRAWVLKGE